MIGRTRIVDVIDKGAGKGALLLTEREITDKATGAAGRHRDANDFLPRRRRFRRAAAADAGAASDSARARRTLICDLGTRPEMALIYRLSGDYNPLHAEPASAKAAGYPRPILHGLGTFGVSGHAAAQNACAATIPRG